MKKIYAWVLVLMMLTGQAGVLAETAGSPQVTASDWAAAELDRANTLGILPDSFGGSYIQDITRSEFCDLVYKMLNKTAFKLGTVQFIRNPFNDAGGEHILSLYANGIIYGKGDELFAPEDPITREEAATILNRILNKLGIMKAYVDDAYGYQDEGEIAEWARGAVYHMYCARIMRGDTEGFFAPKSFITREQATATTVRIFDLIQKGYKYEETAFSWQMNAVMPADKNYMFSPLSIKLAFAMAANGADGVTRAEILKAIGVTDLDAFNLFTKDLIAEYSQNDKVNLNISNSIWLNTDYFKGLSVDFSQSFKDKITGFYNADSKTVTNADAVSEINKWVSEKTQERIRKVIDDPDFLAALVNTIYFKGEWQTQFDEKATAKDAFIDKNGAEHQIDFMNATQSYAYYGDETVTMVKLPYKDGKTSMYLAMSEKGAEDFEQYVGKMQPARLALSLPKFKTEYSMELIDALGALGVKAAFSPDAADLKPMFTALPENAYISKVIHKTFIEVDENGTEAAAVTAVMVSTTSMPTDQPVPVKFDKPFTYFIRDDVSGEILFVGKYAFVE